VNEKPSCKLRRIKKRHVWFKNGKKNFCYKSRNYSKRKKKSTKCGSRKKKSVKLPKRNNEIVKHPCKKNVTVSSKGKLSANKPNLRRNLRRKLKWSSNVCNKKRARWRLNASV
jgi:hypothetical protein